jgi:hypothetical protein
MVDFTIFFRWYCETALKLIDSLMAVFSTVVIVTGVETLGVTSVLVDELRLQPARIISKAIAGNVRKLII